MYVCSTILTREDSLAVKLLENFEGEPFVIYVTRNKDTETNSLHVGEDYIHRPFSDLALIGTHALDLYGCKNYKLLHLITGLGSTSF